MSPFIIWPVTLNYRSVIRPSEISAPSINRLYQPSSQHRVDAIVERRYPSFEITVVLEIQMVDRLLRIHQEVRERFRGELRLVKLLDYPRDMMSDLDECGRLILRLCQRAPTVPLSSPGIPYLKKGDDARELADEQEMPTLAAIGGTARQISVSFKSIDEVIPLRVHTWILCQQVIGQGATYRERSFAAHAIGNSLAD